MNREKGIARCGLACCLCTENCSGCGKDGCPDAGGCENRRCSIEKGFAHCYECDALCRKGLLGKIKPYAFSRFIQRFGMEKLLNCLERNERNGVVYHRSGVIGDYDDFDDAEALIQFILTGKRA